MTDENTGVGRLIRTIPKGDNRERMVCEDCGFIHYENPKIVVGSVCTWQSEVLLCRRAINPRSGYWTIPAGYMELNETAETGAIREAAEEACAVIDIEGLIAIYNIPRISQVQLIYRATIRDGKYSVGEETIESQLFSWKEIPWGELAFPSVRWSLEHWKLISERADWPPFSNPLGEDGSY